MLERLRGTYEAAGDVESAADVMVMQAEAITDPLPRAEAMVRAILITHNSLRGARPISGGIQCR